MMHLKREKKESKTIGNESNKALLSDNFSATLLTGWRLEDQWGQTRLILDFG